MTFSSRKNILIIDDDETMKEALDILLKEQGYRLYNLASGEKVDKWFDKHRADILLIDHLMPGETGASITRRLRKREDTKKLPIIMIAASPHYRNEGLTSGVDRFIVKPFEIDYLLNEIRHFLG